MKHTLFALNNLSANRMVLMKHTFCAWHTLSAIVWCPWTKRVCLTHPFRKSRGFHVKDFVALLLTFSLIIECQQKATKWRHVLTLKLSYFQFSQQWMLTLGCETVYCDTEVPTFRWYDVPIFRICQSAALNSLSQVPTNVGVYSSGYMAT